MTDANTRDTVGAALLGTLGCLSMLSLSCAEPFETQDTRIDAPRFVYVAADYDTLGAGTQVEAKALFFQENYTLEGSERDITWFMMDPPNNDAAALATITARTPEALAATEGIIVLGSGPDLSVPFPATPYLVPGESVPIAVAGHWAGETDFAYINLTLGESARMGGDLEPATIEFVPDLDVTERGSTLSRSSLSASARQAMSAEAGSPLILPGQAARVSLPGIDMLWRHGGALSTLLPLGDAAVDVLHGTLTLWEEDDEQVLLNRDEAGIVTLVGSPLALGAGAPVVQQIAFCPQGELGPDCLSAGLAHGPLATQWGQLVSVMFTDTQDWETLQASPQPVRIRGAFFRTNDTVGRPFFASAEVITGFPLDDTDPYGVEALDCTHPIPLDRPFSMEHLVYGRCTLEQVSGHELVIDVEFPPFPEAPE